MIRRPPRSTRPPSSAASDVYKRQTQGCLVVEVLSDQNRPGRLGQADIYFKETWRELMIEWLEDENDSGFMEKSAWGDPSDEKRQGDIYQKTKKPWSERTAPKSQATGYQTKMYRKSEGVHQSGRRFPWLSKRRRRTQVGRVLLLFQTNTMSSYNIWDRKGNMTA